MTQWKQPDFSPKATKKAVLSETLQHPLTWLGTSVGILGGMASLLFGGGLLTLVAAGGAGLAVFSWLVNYFGRHKTFSNRYIRELHEELEKRKVDALRKLKTELVNLGSVYGAEKLAQQGAHQFEKVQQKYKNLESLLGEKLSQTEITYNRYVGTAEQVYLSVLDNLLDVVHTLKSIQTIDMAYIEDRKQFLQQLERLTLADEKEWETLNKRIELRQTQIDKVNLLVTNNEEAMTALDHTAASISSMKTTKGQGEADLAIAMQELEVLAKRAREYSR